MRRGKLCAAILLAAFAVFTAANAAEETVDTDKTDEPPKVLSEEFSNGVGGADVVIAASVRNCVIGKMRNYAVLEITEVLKGRHDLKSVYVGYDPEEEGEFFKVDAKGLWLLRTVEDMAYLEPVEKPFFQSDELKNAVGTLLKKQNSDTPDDIELVIRTGKKKYLMDEPIRVDMTVTNKGDRTITFDNAFLWKFSHTYHLVLEKGRKFEKLDLKKLSTGIIGEFSGPQFITLAPGASTSRSFNLIKLVSGKPPGEESMPPRLPECKAYLKINWNTQTLKDLYPDKKSTFAVDGDWTSEEISFRIIGKELVSEEDAIKAIETGSGIANIFDALGSDDETEVKTAVNAFVQYASPALEQKLKTMLVGDNHIEREAAGRSFLWLARHPKLMESNVLIDYLTETGEPEDVGAYNQVLSWVASVAIMQDREDYVAPLVSVLESDDATIFTKKEIIAALNALTGLDLSEENFDETISAFKQWLKESEEGGTEPDGSTATESDGPSDK